MSKDLEFENHGSIILIRPVSDAGQDWVNTNMDSEALSFSGAIVCEPRYVADIVVGAQKDGLEVEGW